MQIRYESSAGLTTVGYRILNADKTEYAALTTTGVTEVSPGGYGVTVADSVLAGRTVEWYEGATYSVAESFPSIVGATVSGGNVYANTQAMANDVVTAAAVADDAINSGALASSAITEIAGGVRTELATELARINATMSTRAAETTAASAKAYALSGSNYAASSKAYALSGSDYAASAKTYALSGSNYAASGKTISAAIKLKTDNLPSDPADQSAVEAAITAATSPLATAANLATVDTVADSILVVAQNILRWFTNKRTVTDSQQVLYADDSTTPAYTQTLTDNGTEVTRGKAT